MCLLIRVPYCLACDTLTAHSSRQHPTRVRAREAAREEEAAFERLTPNVYGLPGRGKLPRVTRGDQSGFDCRGECQPDSVDLVSTEVDPTTTTLHVSPRTRTIQSEALDSAPNTSRQELYLEIARRNSVRRIGTRLLHDNAKPKMYQLLVLVATWRR